MSEGKGNESKGSESRRNEDKGTDDLLASLFGDARVVASSADAKVVEEKKDKPVTTRSQMEVYCRDNSVFLQRDDAKMILQWLYLQIPHDDIHENKEGSSIVADRLTDAQLTHIYNMIKNKMGT